MPELVSVAGGANLGTELDLQAVSEDINARVAEYEPETHPALIIKFDADGATIMLFSSGKYNIAGASTIEELHSTHRHLTAVIDSMFDEKIEAKDVCELRNLVYVDDFGSNLRLEKVTVLLGMENTEYEPEQFPAVDYRPPNNDGIFKVFRTGKVTLTGVTDPDLAKKAFKSLFETLDKATV